MLTAAAMSMYQAKKNGMFKLVTIETEMADDEEESKESTASAQALIDPKAPATIDSQTAMT